MGMIAFFVVFTNSTVFPIWGGVERRDTIIGHVSAMSPTPKRFECVLQTLPPGAVEAGI